MAKIAAERVSHSFTDEVTARFGVLPNFFCSAPSARMLVEQLWGFAKAGYLDSPLPSLFKERLFVHLSRFCEMRYCIVRHVGFLIGEGRPAGDPTVTPQTVEQVLALLQRPLPDATQLALCLIRLEAYRHPVEMPDSGAQLEGDLFDALTIIFLEPRHAGRARRAVAGAFGEFRFEILTAFLAFIRTAHFWTETHPTLEYEADMLAVMAQHDALAKLLLDQTEAERAKASVALRRTLAELQESRGKRARAEEALRITEERLQVILNAARMAYWEWDFTTDTVNASSTMDDLFGLPAGERFQTNNRGFDLVHPEDQPGHREKVAAAAREGGTWHHTFRVIRPRDGKVVWLEEHAHAMPDARHGKVVHGRARLGCHRTQESRAVAREAEWAVVSVCDNGIGIPADDLPRIFELFSQVRLHQGHSEGGLGIGLSIVRKLVEMHQGTVSVASEGSGRGSTFMIRLPLIRTVPLKNV